MTGLPPYSHGLRENGVTFDGKHPTLASKFRAAGYDTAAFVGAYVLNRRFGLDAGFEIYNDGVRRMRRGRSCSRRSGPRRRSSMRR